MASKTWKRLLLGGALACPVLAAANPAEATVVERVVAVVGERAILLSDLRTRAKPLIVRIYQEVPTPAQRAAATSSMYKTLLERMVEEELERRAASRSRITVSAREIDDAIVRLAGQQKLSVEKLLREAVNSGLSIPAYRSEIRRQLLEAKLLNLRVAGRIRITEDDIRSTYRKFVTDERKKLSFRAAWIRIRAPRDGSKKSLRSAQKLADRLSQQAQKGADFSALARRYSDDNATKSMGGLMGRMKPRQLSRSLGRIAMNLEVGEVSLPTRDGDDIVVLKMLERDPSALPTFQEAQGELKQRVYLEKMAKARKQWLTGLRRRSHVEIRL